MPVQYISTQDFKQDLNEWLSTGNPVIMDKIARSKNQIPLKFRGHPGKLYMGVGVNDKFIDAANLGRASFDMPPIWTKDQQKARQTIANSKGDDKYLILITKVVPANEQILDVEAFGKFFGIEQLTMLGFNGKKIEEMVAGSNLVTSRQVRITRSDYTIIQQPSHKGI